VQIVGKTQNAVVSYIDSNYPENFMKIIKTILMLMLAAALHLPSFAIAANLLSNGGFESPGTVTTYKFLSNNDSASVTGWPGTPA
jgi:hypothetical protein